MAIALPSKKIQALIIIVLALFFAYFVSTLNVRSWFSSLFASSDKISYNSTSLEPVDANISSDLDTDHDGLKDWQESLWGTDRENNDTDGDGTKDGDEIEKGRDPKIAGPEDSLEKTRGISASSVTAFSASVAVDPDNLSQTVSRDLFAKFMSLQTSGNLTDVSQAELIASVISDIDPGSIPPRFSIADVSITETNAVSLRSYGNDLATILFSIQAGAKKSSNNTTALSSYSSAIGRLQKIKVPGILGLTHLQILNNFNASYQMLNLLANYESDPVKGLVALKSVQTNTENGIALLEIVASELKKNAIIFGTNESGYIWNKY